MSTRSGLVSTRIGVDQKYAGFAQIQAVVVRCLPSSTQFRPVPTEFARCRPNAGRARPNSGRFREKLARFGQHRVVGRPMLAELGQIQAGLDRTRPISTERKPSSTKFGGSASRQAVNGQGAANRAHPDNSAVSVVCDQSSQRSRPSHSEHSRRPGARGISNIPAQQREPPNLSGSAASHWLIWALSLPQMMEERCHLRWPPWPHSASKRQSCRTCPQTGSTCASEPHNCSRR